MARLRHASSSMDSKQVNARAFKCIMLTGAGASTRVSMATLRPLPRFTSPHHLSDWINWLAGSRPWSTPLAFLLGILRGNNGNSSPLMARSMPPTLHPWSSSRSINPPLITRSRWPRSCSLRCDLSARRIAFTPEYYGGLLIALSSVPRFTTCHHNLLASSTSHPTSTHPQYYLCIRLCHMRIRIISLQRQRSNISAYTSAQQHLPLPHRETILKKGVPKSKRRKVKSGNSTTIAATNAKDYKHQPRCSQEEWTACAQQAHALQIKLQTITNIQTIEPQTIKPWKRRIITYLTFNHAAIKYRSSNPPWVPSPK